MWFTHALLQFDSRFLQKKVNIFNCVQFADVQYEIFFCFRIPQLDMISIIEPFTLSQLSKTYQSKILTVVFHDLFQIYLIAFYIFQIKPEHSVKVAFLTKRGKV